MRLIIFLLTVVTVTAVSNYPAAALTSRQNSIDFQSFTGVYHLSRDRSGLSLLTSEETILAEFPSQGGFYGVTRQLAGRYQGRSVHTKVLSLTDAAGNPLPYKISTDSNQNLIVTTGDPAITLYGSQTFRLRYQTQGVINLSSKHDEFLLNVNGRGWNQPLGRVNATVYLPASLKANLINGSACYRSLNNLDTRDCQLTVNKKNDTTVVYLRADSVAAHQAVLLKLNFKSATFTNPQQVSKIWLTLAATILFILSLAFYYTKYKKR